MVLLSSLHSSLSRISNPTSNPNLNPKCNYKPNCNYKTNPKRNPNPSEEDACLIKQRPRNWVIKDNFHVIWVKKFSYKKIYGVTMSRKQTVEPGYELIRQEVHHILLHVFFERIFKFIAFVFALCKVFERKRRKTIKGGNKLFLKEK